MKVTTTYTSRKGSGASIIVARSGGKQKTMPYDQRLSPGQNHGQAAKALVTRITPAITTQQRLNSVKCISHENGKAVFTYND